VTDSLSSTLLRVDKAKSSVVLTASTLEFDLYLPANKRCVKLVELYEDIDVEASQYKILGTKVSRGSWPRSRTVLTEAATKDRTGFEEAIRGIILANLAKTRRGVQIASWVRIDVRSQRANGNCRRQGDDHRLSFPSHYYERAASR
jgi:hypothetical protein